MIEAFFAISRRNQSGFQFEMLARIFRPMIATGTAILFFQNHPRTNRVVRQPINQNERAGTGIGFIRIIRDRLIEAEQHMADFIHRQFGGRPFFQGVDIDGIPQLGDFSGDLACGLFDGVGFAGDERLLRHPDHHRLDLLADVRHVIGMHQHVATADIDLIVQCDRDGHRRKRLLQLPIISDDRCDTTFFAARKRHHLIALVQNARGNGACESAKIKIGPKHILHGETHLGQIAIGCDMHGFQVTQQRPAFIPGHGRALIDDIIALQRAHRNELDIGNAQLGDEVRVVGLDLLEPLLREADEIHLVDRDNNVLDA